MLLINLITFTKLIFAEKENETKVGFYNVNDNEQNMTIDVSLSFCTIKEAYLMEKANTNDATDYVNTKNIKKYCRTFRDKKEWETFNKNLKDMPKTSEEYSKLRNKRFNTIYIDLKGVPANKDVTYTINLKTDAGQNVTTRAFYYSEKRKRWQLGEADSEKSSKMWLYIGIRVVGALIIGAVVAAFV